MHTNSETNNKLTFEDFKKEVLSDYKIAVTSRECSYLGRRELLTGKAKFGIFGDGKEVPQLAWAKAFKNGDWRSGYYRDQTFMMAIGKLTIQQFFAGLYAHTDDKADPMSAGRQMGGHFSTHSLNDDNSWKNLANQKNSSPDISPTAGQMPRLVGLAHASKIYRNQKGLENHTSFSSHGNEVAWGTIGNASTSEGLFWESINAAGVLQIPMVVNVWDDDYGISVHAKYQTTKENISEILKGFQRSEDSNGYEIIRVYGWDYPNLVEAYQKASKIAREEHVPVLIHVNELTQPQGHSTSGSHERYKDKDRLNWEKEHDCNVKMRQWIVESNLATEEELTSIEKTIKKEVREGKNAAWKAFLKPQIDEQKEALTLINNAAEKSANKAFIDTISSALHARKEPLRREIIGAARKTLRYLIGEKSVEKEQLRDWIENYFELIEPKYSAHLYSEANDNALTIQEVKPNYEESSEAVDARILLRDNFDAILTKYPEVVIFGEDSGTIGDVNQGLEGLQSKFGEIRVTDTGIREATILGQGIGMSMRGLRPIAEIQYLDYILYCLQIMSDDLATVRYRTNGKQKAPLIVRTRGHRLEGIWHSGSQMGGLVHLLRGMYILVPRNMTKAVGFYNTLLKTDEPALVVECLNGYRLKEKMPTNLTEITTPIGIVETVKNGTDITLVSYGSTLRVVQEASKELQEVGINAEVIDIQTLLPLDLNKDIVKSVAKTNRLLVVDEDVPGGASSYIMQNILDTQNGYQYLDSKPQTLTAKQHRPAYGTDGDYFSKPQVEDVFEKVYEMMNEVSPNDFPKLR
jgi:pyruvate/2-oxoglutarate/acetoin dehydrogenase E1 component/TPP-dependent pyruvate/acetoin dehydrogenase alpha subunit